MKAITTMTMLVLLSGCGSIKTAAHEKKDRADEAGDQGSTDAADGEDDAPLAQKLIPATTASAVFPASPTPAKPKPSDVGVVKDAGALQDQAALGLADPAFAVIGSELKTEACSLAAGEVVAVTKIDQGQAALKFFCGTTAQEVTVPVDDLKLLAELDKAKVADVVDTALTVGDEEITFTNKLTTAATPDVEPVGCTARLGIYTAARDIIPFPTSNCAAPQPASTPAEKTALANAARAKGDEIFNAEKVRYHKAQAAIANLQSRRADIGRAYLYASHKTYSGEFHHRSDKWRDTKHALVAMAQAIDQQINYYVTIPVPNEQRSRGAANAALLKGVCVLSKHVFNKGGAYANKIYGIVLETAKVDTFKTTINFDDHPALPASDGWGGILDATTDNETESTRITRRPLADFIPPTAAVGAPIVWMDFQALDAKGVALGAACTIRIGLR